MGEPLLFLPGLLCDRRLFAPQIAALGGGRELHVADLTQGDTTAGMAARVLAGAPPRFALCGLSMGGYVALEIMRQGGERVTRLALLDTQARADTPEITARRRGLIELARKGEFKGVTPRLLPLLLHPDRLEDDGLVAIVLSMADAIGKVSFLSQQQALMTRSDLRPELGKIACPTLVLCGRQDALTPPPLSEEMAAAIQGATLVVLPRCGHLSTLERPDAVTAQLRTWLAI